MLPIIVIALCLLATSTAEIQLLSCTTASTGPCNSLGGCNLPNDIANCQVNWNGTLILCTTPPPGYVTTGTTCFSRIGCSTCSANVRSHPQPVCELRKV